MHKILIIYYRWPNTSNNHAGMAYLVNKIKLTYPESIRLIKVPEKWNSWRPKIRRAWHLLLICYLKIFLRKTDRILFMEYLGNRSGDQSGLAIKIKKNGLKNKLSGLVHLSPSHLKEVYEDKSIIIQSLNAIDNIVVLGTSLERYFIELGFSNKVKKTFHYVDTQYYHPILKNAENRRLRVIIMGSLKRNHKLLKEIVIQCPFADFDICMGGNEYSNLFNDHTNLTIHDYLPERELLTLMQQSDVSLSVLYDTVGSNVIVTSLATGLVNVVSDVGSIRDYCSERDSFLCKEKHNFINALEILDTDRQLLKELSLNSIEKSNQINLQKFISIFPSLIE